jgi:hypothetical protein
MDGNPASGGHAMERPGRHRSRWRGLSAARALTAGPIAPGVTASDITALVWAMRGLAQGAGDAAPGTWQRFLDVHLAGLRTAAPLSSAPAAGNHGR